MELTRSVQCDLPGYEQVEIVFNMLATGHESDTWQTSLGAECTDKVVSAVRNWPGPGDPFDRDTSPFAFRVWACRVAIIEAYTAFLTDPFGQMPSKASTAPTAGAAS